LYLFRIDRGKTHILKQRSMSNMLVCISSGLIYFVTGWIWQAARISITVNSTVSGHRQFRVNFRKRNLFFPNGIVFRYFDYPVIFSNLLAAWNVMLAVETWLITYLITQCFSAPLHGKVKVPAIYVTAKTSVWSRNCRKTCTY